MERRRRTEREEVVRQQTLNFVLSVRADDTVCERPFLRTVRWKVNTILSVCDPLESVASLSVIVLGKAPMVRFAL